MAYTIVKSLDAEYAVDWDVVERLCMSYWQTYYQLRYSSTKSMSESNWYNPLSWKLPEIQTLEVDWEAARQSAHRACIGDMFTYSQQASRSMRDVAYDVKYKVEQTGVQRRALVNQLKDIQSSNLSAMDRAVDGYSGLIEASRFIRDTSADVVAIGSTIATGGAAAGLLGASSALKGYGKYQDTGKVGASVLYGAGSMALGAFKVGSAKLTTAGEYTLIIAQGALETGTSLTAGDSFGKALETGGLKIASAGGAQVLFGSSWMKQIFARLPIPINVWVPAKEGPGQMFIDEANALAEKVSKKLTEKGVKSLAKSAISEPPPADAQPTSVQSGLMNDVPLEQTLLLYLSIVHMKKGVGRGW